MGWDMLVTGGCVGHIDSIVRTGLVKTCSSSRVELEVGMLSPQLRSPLGFA